MDSFNAGIPFLGPRQPDYPPLLQLLRVTSATVPGPSGGSSAGVGTGNIPPGALYVASTQQLRTDTLSPRDREPCLALDVNGYGLIQPGQSFAYWHGRLAGSFNGLPVYEVTVGPNASSVIVSGGGATLASSEGILGSQYAFTLLDGLGWIPVRTSAPADFELVVADGGTYLLWANVRVQVTLPTNGMVPGLSTLWGRFYDSTAGVAVGNSQKSLLEFQGASGAGVPSQDKVLGTVTMISVAGITAGHHVRLEINSNINVNGSNNAIGSIGDDANGHTTMGYIKLA